MGTTVTRLKSLKNRIKDKMTHMEFDTIADYVEVGMQEDIISNGYDLQEYDLQEYVSTLKNLLWDMDESSEYTLRTNTQKIHDVIDSIISKLQ